jgi:predicted nucleic acid-binding protein
MKLVVDTNIILGGLIRDSLLRKIILSDIFDLYAPEYIFEETLKHKKTILEKSGMSEDNFTALLMLLEKHISFIEKSEYNKNLSIAEEIMRNIDITDSVFIAAALSLKCST